MSRNVNRIGAVGFMVAVSAALTLPGTANAAEGVDPVIVGECDATLKGENGKPLTVDLGAAANAPGLLDLGLSSKSPGGNGKAKPLLSLPVKEALDGLGISKTGLVVDTAGTICDTAQTTTNAVGATTQGLLGGDGAEQPPPDDNNPGPKPPPAPNPPEEDDDDPAEDAPIQTNPGTGGGSANSGVDSSFLPLGQALIGPAAMIGPVLPPGVAPPAAPNLGEQLPPQVLAENSGTAEALPGATPPQRVPLLIAVLAVVVVAALLARTWLRRRAA
ncbi:hypothetical protein [Amycolatopsis albispora]|uniref:Uncharacterized protein n=1 Tax=Amycolatopsis albispora TaxID=1804986 RepID=A0A344LE30_9PSEU|nr:hypothetical protein [Amycolatopsis albispora]AXB46304.1 hypothetical protein A4R43_30785 [Amycolatopsis albispora]